MRREAILGALVTLTLFLGIPLLWSLDPRGDRAPDPIRGPTGTRLCVGRTATKGKRPRGKARLQSRLLQGLPGVGPERARRLLERFGTIEAVVAASADALAAVPGIGKGTAEAIRWAVQEPRDLYGIDSAPDDLWSI